MEQLLLLRDGLTEILFGFSPLLQFVIVGSNGVEGIDQLLLSFLVVSLPLHLPQGLLKVVVNCLCVNVVVFDLVPEGRLWLAGRVLYSIPAPPGKLCSSQSSPY